MCKTYIIKILVESILVVKMVLMIYSTGQSWYMVIGTEIKLVTLSDTFSGNTCSRKYRSGLTNASIDNKMGA